MRKIISAMLTIVLILSLTSCMNDAPIKMQSDTNNNPINENGDVKKGKVSGKIKVINNDNFANASHLYTTDKYIYYIENGVHRYNKTTGTSTIISDKNSAVVGVTEDTVYYIETSKQFPNLYKISDDIKESEYLYQLSSGKSFFMDEKNIYSVSSNGSITKNKNSSNGYQNSEEIIYQGAIGDLREIKMYNDYIYYATTNGDLIRVSLSNGNSELICSGLAVDKVQNRPYYFCGNKIVLVKNIEHEFDFHIYSMNLDGSNIKEITSVAGTNSYCVANGFLYAFVKDVGLSRVNLETEEYTPLGGKDTGTLSSHLKEMTDTGEGIAYGGSARVNLFDYDGNLLKTMQ